MTRLIAFSLLNALIVLLLVPGTAIADGKATLIMTQPGMQVGGRSVGGGETKETVRWRDADTVRIDKDQSHYSLLRDGKKYWIDQSQSAAKVMDLPAMTADSDSRDKSKNPFSIEATGASETIAGIEGRVYKVTITVPDVGSHSFETVHTDDPLVVEMTRAYFNATGGMLASDAFHDSLPDDDHGLLRKGDELRLDSISRTDLPESTFELPAKPEGT